MMLDQPIPMEQAFPAAMAEQVQELARVAVRLHKQQMKAAAKAGQE